MTQQEFAERTGYTPTADVYESIEKAYMDTDLDKDTFCKAWKGNRTLLVEIKKQTLRARELAAQRNQMVDFLIEQAEKWSASDLREKAIDLVGEKEYIRRKIEKGFNLWKADKEILIEILKR